MADIIGKNHTILLGDVMERLKDIPEESVQVCVTSPPYWNLRSYATAKWEGGDPNCKHKPKAYSNAASTLGGEVANANHAEQKAVDQCPSCGAVKVEDKQLGLEKEPDCLGWATGKPCGECYVCHLVQVFREVRRVLRKDGTAFLNLGDSYNSKGGHSKTESDGRSNRDARQQMKGADVKWLKNQDLIMIPSRVALALQADGWWLRGDIVWAKRVPMPESVKNRCTRSHEFIFHLAKSEKYFFDNLAIKEPVSQSMIDKAKTGEIADKEYKHDSSTRLSAGVAGVRSGNRVFSDQAVMDNIVSLGRNKRDVWFLSTSPSRIGHYAQFIPQVPLTCILAGSSEKGSCPDCGAPWSRIKTGNFTDHDGESETEYEEGSTANRLAKMRQASREAGEEYEPEEKTVTWAPSCKCHVDFEAMDCSRCHKPLRVQISAPTDPAAYEAWKSSCGSDSKGEYAGKSVKDFAAGGAQDASDVKRRILEGMIPATGMKWELSCECGLPERVPCTVLDPFWGSGTTGAVAEFLNRKVIGCELSDEYADLYDARRAEVVRALVGGKAPKRDEKNGDQIGLFESTSANT